MPFRDLGFNFTYYYFINSLVCVSQNLFCLIDDASEVQGERRAELVRALLSRSLHSPLQLVCDGKGTATFQTKRTFCRFSSGLYATRQPVCDKQPKSPPKTVA